MSRETAPRFAGIGGHHSKRSGTVEWLTPPSIIAALGPFDLDPCAPLRQPYPTAARMFTRLDNGLIQRWSGRVWLNPPYSDGVIERWLAKMAEHDRGTALIFARTETEAFCRQVWDRATALLFMEGRINFHLPDGTMARGNAGAPTVLCAYGADDADVLAGCDIAGRFVPLRIPRQVFVQLFFKKEREVAATWRQVIADFFEGVDGPVDLDDLYRAFAGSEKARRNPNYQAKIRQQLQVGDYERVGRGRWATAEK